MHNVFLQTGEGEGGGDLCFVNYWSKQLFRLRVSYHEGYSTDKPQKIYVSFSLEEKNMKFL